jgi:hypothetical protein
MSNFHKIAQGIDASAQSAAASLPTAFWVDDFLIDPVATRLDAIGAEFIDWEGPDGQVYKRVCLKEVPGLREGLERIFGGVEILAQGYRLNYAGEPPNQSIHADIGWGDWAAVLCLTNGPGGTALWRHRETGAEAIHSGQHDLLARLQADFVNADAWELRSLSPMAFNRCAIYDSRLFHSRWPFEAFGSTPEDGRLVAVAFFNAKVRP